MTDNHTINNSSQELYDINKEIIDLNIESKVTCVSGYWKVKNKHGNQFNKWFQNSLKINCPYVFFGNKETIENVKKHRIGLPTYYIELNIEDFVTYEYRHNMTTHKAHCSSVELNLIWNEKIFMIQRALKINPFSSDFFTWIDAGLCMYRNSKPPTSPFPNPNKLNKLPTNKFIYCSSHNKILNKAKFKKGKYVHNHHVSAGIYILHKNIIDDFVELYRKYLKLIDKDDIWTEQVILTLIYIDNKNLFHKYCDGYATLCSNLY